MTREIREEVIGGDRVSRNITGVCLNGETSLLPFPPCSILLVWNADLMARAPAAILEYKILRIDPKMGEQKMGMFTGPGLSASGFLLRDVELTSIFVPVSDSQALACIRITWRAG